MQEQIHGLQGALDQIANGFENNRGRLNRLDGYVENQARLAADTRLDGKFEALQRLIEQQVPRELPLPPPPLPLPEAPAAEASAPSGDTHIKIVNAKGKNCYMLDESEKCV